LRCRILVGVVVLAKVEDGAFDKKTLGVLLAALAAVGGLIWLAQHKPPSSPVPAVIESRAAPKLVPDEKRSAVVSSSTQPTAAAWRRPSASIASRNFRRSGFAWILHQLGASDQLLDRLVDRDLVAALTELKQQASGGDATAINILGEIAYQQCFLGRSANVLDEYQASQLGNTRALPAKDQAWFEAAFRYDIAYDKQMQSVCAQVVDVDQALGWVEARANQGDGASLWLQSRLGNNLAQMQQRLRDAAAAGFPEAQFELA
jgi:hypothetical protein